MVTKTPPSFCRAGISPSEMPDTGLAPVWVAERDGRHPAPRPSLGVRRTPSSAAVAADTRSASELVPLGFQLCSIWAVTASTRSAIRVSSGVYQSDGFPSPAPGAHPHHHERHAAASEGPDHPHRVEIHMRAAAELVLIAECAGVGGWCPPGLGGGGSRRLIPRRGRPAGEHLRVARTKALIPQHGHPFPSP